MAYIIDKPIRVEYQPAGGTAGLTVSIEVLDETGFTDLVNFPVFTLTEMPLAGGSMYQGAFTPDAIGIWTIHISDSAGGLGLKQYTVVKDIDSILTAPTMVA